MVKTRAVSQNFVLHLRTISLSNAFLSAPLATIQEFHHERLNRNAHFRAISFFKLVLPNTSIYKLALFQFFNALGSRADSVCFEHSNFVNVNVPAHQDTQSRRLQMIV